MSEEEKKDRFGRYLILDHLVDGGMAKICRARFLGEQADKIVAIKMVQPQFSQDESFKTMFMDEIKVTFGLLHPNIVQTYDYGLHNEQLYVAMEYCDGRNLKEYLDRLKQKKFVFPVEISSYIISQVCQGLHYAHTLTDKLTGKEANIIHRDISPHNIMLTYDGAIKVIDFGIAKAESNSEATQAGTIKGKLSYLAPEYLEGMELDHRYDQFAVGITLWEMLCSRKLFKAANDLAVLKKIQECKIPPPSSINPNVPEELDKIVMKSLSKDRNKRFENMDKFNRALIKFLYANFPEFNASDLSYFAKELFKEEIKKDREKLFEYGKIDIKPYLEDLKREQAGGSGGGATAASSEGGQAKKREEVVLDFGFDDEDGGDDTNVMAAARAARKNKEGTKTLNLKRKLGDDSLKMEAKSRKVVREDDEETHAPTESRSKTKTRARKKKSGTKTKSGTTRAKIKMKKKKKSSMTSIAVVASLVLAVYFGKDDIPFINKYIGQERVPTSVTQPVKKNPVVKKNEPVIEEPVNDGGYVKVRLSPFSKHTQNVYVNSKKVKPDFLSSISVPLGETSYIRVETPGKKHFVTSVSPESEEAFSINIPEMPDQKHGYVFTSRGCRMIGTLHFELYGEKRVEQLPVKSRLGIVLPVQGDGRFPADESGNAEYTMYFQRSGEKIQRKLQFKFNSADQRLDLCSL
ncbi:MAG: serine/threonine protein kinase [Oligoflexia bacterium]|nr:serine/threonine protein kinase [Oligoflexia bacterium]